MTPPLSEPMIPDGDPCHAVHAGIEAPFETPCTEKLPLMERADRLHECKVGGLYGARTIGGERKALIFSSALSATSQNRGSRKWRLRGLAGRSLGSIVCYAFANSFRLTSARL